MSPVRAADPRAAELDQAFTDAMGAAMSGQPRAETPPPPEIDPDAPFGRDEDGTPRAPLGKTKDGKVRRTAAGRPRKDDQPRTGTAEPGPRPPATPAAKTVPEPPPGGYGKDLAEFADAVWVGLSVVAEAGPGLPLVGRYVPGARLGAQAAVFCEHRGQLAGAVAIAAEHNAHAARFAARISTGGITWTLMCGMMILPFVTMSRAVWEDNTDKAGRSGGKVKPNQALAEAGLPPLAELAEHNRAAWRAKIAEYSAQMQQAAEAMAERTGEAADAPAA